MTLRAGNKGELRLSLRVHCPVTVMFLFTFYIYFLCDEDMRTRMTTLLESIRSILRTQYTISFITTKSFTKESVSMLLRTWSITSLCRSNSS